MCWSWVASASAGSLASRSAPNSRMVSSSQYRCGVLLRAQHHRLVDQADQGGQDVLAGQRPAGAERLGGGEVERSGEHRQPRPEQLLLRRAEVVAPLRGGAQRLLVRQGPAAAGREQAEAMLQPAAQLRQRQGAQLHRGQLDRQRDAVQAPAQPDHLAAVGRRDGEAGRGRRGPLGEQFHRVAAPALAGTARPVPPGWHWPGWARVLGPAAAAPGSSARPARSSAGGWWPGSSPGPRSAAPVRPASRTHRSGARRSRG